MDFGTDQFHIPRKRLFLFRQQEIELTMKRQTLVLYYMLLKLILMLLLFVKIHFKVEHNKELVS